MFLCRNTKKASQIVCRRAVRHSWQVASHLEHSCRMRRTLTENSATHKVNLATRDSPRVWPPLSSAPEFSQTWSLATYDFNLTGHDSNLATRGHPIMNRHLTAPINSTSAEGDKLGSWRAARSTWRAVTWLKTCLLHYGDYFFSMICSSPSIFNHLKERKREALEQIYLPFRSFTSQLSISSLLF